MIEEQSVMVTTNIWILYFSFINIKLCWTHIYVFSNPSYMNYLHKDILYLFSSTEYFGNHIDTSKSICTDSKGLSILSYNSELLIWGTSVLCKSNLQPSSSKQVHNKVKISISFEATQIFHGICKFVLTE